MKGAQTKERQRLLSMIKGGNGVSGTYIEIIHRRTPEGEEIGEEYAVHFYEGEDYCPCISAKTEEDCRLIIGVGAASYKADGTLFGEEKLREAETAPVYDFGTVKTVRL